MSETAQCPDDRPACGGIGEDGVGPCPHCIALAPHGLDCPDHREFPTPPSVPDLDFAAAVAHVYQFRALPSVFNAGGIWADAGVREEIFAHLTVQHHAALTAERVATEARYAPLVKAWVEARDAYNSTNEWKRSVGIAIGPHHERLYTAMEALAALAHPEAPR